MKLSTKGRYGLKAMVDLAIHSEKCCIPLNQVAQRQDLSDNYLEQLFSSLKKGGLVKSTRGAQGVYSLAKSPEHISIGEILRALEGSLAPVDCVATNEKKECEDSDYCVTKSVWKRVNDSINHVVDSIMLQDLVDDYNKIHQESCENNQEGSESHE